MELIVKRFEELTPRELYEILRLRQAVFVVEQNCPYQDIDGKDLSAWHVFLREGERAEAYLRVLDPGISFPEVSLGRVVTGRRGEGLGARILAEGLRVARTKLGARAVRIEAQSYARGFYEKAGFRQCSGEFLEDGIPHVQMLWTED